MAEKKREPTPRERWGEWIIVTVLALAGLALIFASLANKGILQEVLATIGLNFLSSAAVTTFILLLVGNDVGGLKSQINNLEQEVDKLHEIIVDETDAMYKNIGKLSTLLTDACSLGIVGLGRSRYVTAFDGNKNLGERWKYLLEYAHEVEVICFADRLLFNYEIFDRFFTEKIKARMEQEGEKGLKLRIILSNEDNLYNKVINEWSGDPSFVETRIHYARIILTRLCGGTLNPDVVKEHKSFVPFTLIRGDSYIYVMFFLPGHSGGPVLEIRPLEMIAYPRITHSEDDKHLFRIYKSYFDDMWLKCGGS